MTRSLVESAWSHVIAHMGRWSATLHNTMLLDDTVLPCCSERGEWGYKECGDSDLDPPAVFKHPMLDAP